jgi:hypothetical protein
MSVEAIIYDAIGTIANGNVFPDIAPAFPSQANPGPPWITYQEVGGQAFNTLDSTTPVLRNSRVAIKVYSLTRGEACAVLEQCFQALANPIVKAVPIGAPISTFEAATLLYGSALDFSITFNV